jgi:RES domain-containing protein
MLTAWRLTEQINAVDAFGGRGACALGGRWNSPGYRDESLVSHIEIDELPENLGPLFAS